MAAESFDAVLAEILRPESLRLHMGELTADEVRIAQAAVRLAHGRLQAAHEREVGAANEYAERCTAANTEAERENDRLRSRADAAVALLRECEDAVFGKELWERIRAFLAHGGQEKGNG